MGRKKFVGATILARLPEGTIERIEEVLHEDEKRSEFIREAIEREIKRRERLK
jgi:metal-responsive CopG/Arc/MetJ family transcriptional regulator